MRVLKLESSKKWICPFDKFLEEASKIYPITRAQVYKKITCGRFEDGYVIKKDPFTGRLIGGCLEDYKKCLGIY